MKTALQKSGKLILTGIGMKLISHTTDEAKRAIENADKVYYVSCHPFMDEYLKQLNTNAHSLNYLYESKESRLDTYHSMKDVVVDAVVNEALNVCMVFYGHPCVFAKPGMLAIKELRELGYPCTVMPGVSALDCLFSDLLIDSVDGYACFESTELVQNKRQLDPSAYMILWQPYMFANFSVIEKSNDLPDETFNEFTQYLLQFYPNDHKVVVYSAAMFPGATHNAREIMLSRLTREELTVECTLVVPPLALKH